MASLQRTHCSRTRYGNGPGPLLLFAAPLLVLAWILAPIRDSLAYVPSMPGLVSQPPSEDIGAEPGFVRLFPPALHARLSPPPTAGMPHRGALREKSTSATAGENAASPSGSRKPAPKSFAVRASAPLTIVKSTAPGQSGYVHYFVLDMPDETRETQVGIEMADGSIAWSFPELGVMVSPFIESGHLVVNGRPHKVQHLYGIRPFPDEESMSVLRKSLAVRVMPWIDDQTPYCNSTERPRLLCLNCLGFALHILFPGKTPAFPALPADFARGSSDPYYTTDDLLAYLTGLNGLRTTDARLKRINHLALPEDLRDELTRLAHSMENEHGAGPHAGKSLTGKIRSGIRSYSRTPPQRKRL